MKSIEILHPGLLTTIQDSGRIGHAYYAVPRSGVMDTESYDRIKTILQIDDDISILECTLNAPKIRFHQDFRIVVSGADLGWKLNNLPIQRNTMISVKSGDMLSGGFAKSGFRGYIGFSDEMQVDNHLGSTSSYHYAFLGANAGQPLRAGDVITFTPLDLSHSLEVTLGGSDFRNLINIQKGPEFDFLIDNTDELLCSSAFIITPESNRMGARLKGPRLKIKHQLNKSVPVLPGFIQLLPSGQLIVLLQDGQSTGGYPRIAYLSQDELSIFNQIAIGKVVRFVLGD